MQWMLWTLPTALFFGSIALLLLGMLIWEILQPCVERRGWIIPMRTTRGDRLFIGLLSSAYIAAFWLVFVPLSMWWMAAITIAILVILQAVG
ncbi:MAG: DUF2160 family membrane protein [Salinisphaera sp.]|jgi:predicted small integral membrane protein|nr:DUF2160 family membrane protein [Salinisphaera sp.]